VILTYETHVTLAGYAYLAGFRGSSIIDVVEKGLEGRMTGEPKIDPQSLRSLEAILLPSTLSTPSKFSKDR
jgi:hypothetical protein